ncbi:MAG: hypothetical protein H0V68_12390 [Actinobacteria bacterium]|nr:hypothetical protein [Actinomycetota bacterium]
MSILALALFVVAAVTAAAAGAVPAIAAPPETVAFTVAGEFDAPSGVFTSDGSVVCASGSTSDDFFPSGFQSDAAEGDAGGVVLHDRKTVTCDDGSGTFTLLLQGRTGFNVGEGTFGRWVVLSGTGEYTDLHGRGTFTGTYRPSQSGLDEDYAGWLALR